MESATFRCVSLPILHARPAARPPVRPILRPAVRSFVYTFGTIAPRSENKRRSILQVPKQNADSSVIPNENNQFVYFKVFLVVFIIIYWFKNRSGFFKNTFCFSSSPLLLLLFFLLLILIIFFLLKKSIICKDTYFAKFHCLYLDTVLLIKAFWRELLNYRWNEILMKKKIIILKNDD